jgi:hypothetical protein
MSHDFILLALLREPNFLTKCGGNGGSVEISSHTCRKITEVYISELRVPIKLRLYLNPHPFYYHHHIAARYLGLMACSEAKRKTKPLLSNRQPYLPVAQPAFTNEVLSTELRRYNRSIYTGGNARLKPFWRLR